MYVCSSRIILKILNLERDNVQTIYMYTLSSSDVTNWLITCAQKPCSNFQSAAILLFLVCHFSLFIFIIQEQKTPLISSIVARHILTKASQRTFYIVTFTFQN